MKKLGLSLGQNKTSPPEKQYVSTGEWVLLAETLKFVTYYLQRSSFVNDLQLLWGWEETSKRSLCLEQVIEPENK